MAPPPGCGSASPGDLGSAYPTGSQKAGKNGVLCHLFPPSPPPFSLREMGLSRSGTVTKAPGSLYWAGLARLGRADPAAALWLKSVGERGRSGIH